jgi:hypothetical protein
MGIRDKNPSLSDGSDQAVPTTNFRIGDPAKGPKSERCTHFTSSERINVRNDPSGVKFRGRL